MDFSSSDMYAYSGNFDERGRMRITEHRSTLDKGLDYATFVVVVVLLALGIAGLGLVGGSVL